MSGPTELPLQPADQLCLGHKTVANYATQIKKKLQVDTTAELAHIAVNLGIMVL